MHWSCGPRIKIFKESVIVTVRVWRYRYWRTEVIQVGVM